MRIVNNLAPLASTARNQPLNNWLKDSTTTPSHFGQELMEFLEVPLFDDDLFKLNIRLAFDLLFTILVVWVAYKPDQKRMNYVFMFMLMNIMVFFICFTLKKLDLGLGMALGLFAIFAIIRYRTNSIKVKEMTYLFIVIGLAVINALSNKQTSYAELLYVNSAIFVITLLMERSWSRRIADIQSIIYDKIDLLRPERRGDLISDLRLRTGLDINQVDIKRVDLKKQLAQIVIYYKTQTLHPNDQNPTPPDHGDSTHNKV